MVTPMTCVHSNIPVLSQPQTQTLNENVDLKPYPGFVVQNATLIWVLIQKPTEW